MKVIDPQVASSEALGIFSFFHGEVVLEQSKVRSYPEMALAERHVVADRQDGIRGNIVGLEPIGLQDF
jgi:hypothetical protein